MHSLEPGELEHGHCPYWSDHKLITKYNDEVNTINKVIRNKRLLKLSKKIFASYETEVKVLTSLMPSYETCLCNDHFIIIQNTGLKMLIHHLKVIMDSLKDAEIQIGTIGEHESFVACVDPKESRILHNLQLLLLPCEYQRETFIPPSDKLINILHFIHSIEAVGIILPNCEGLRSKIGLINVEN